MEREQLHDILKTVYKYWNDFFSSSMPEHGQILFIRAGFPFIKVSLIFLFTTEENIQNWSKASSKANFV